MGLLDGHEKVNGHGEIGRQSWRCGWLGKDGRQRRVKEEQGMARAGRKKQGGRGQGIECGKAVREGLAGNRGTGSGNTAD